MQTLPHSPKGARTRARILDAAEALFATRGFGGTSLREIAGRAGIREPGLYNYFASKRDLYAAVLDRAFGPLADAMQAHFGDPASADDVTALPAVMTDLLLEHPQMAALFHHALLGDPESEGNQLVQDWLERLFRQAIDGVESRGARASDREELAIQTIAMFNLCTGYFTAQPIFGKLARGSVTDPDNVERQKRLLDRIARAALA